MFKPVAGDVVWREIDRERQRLLAYLRTLSSTEWDHYSLCEGWQVRDVVAHLLLEYRYGRAETALGIVKSGFSINRFIFSTAIQQSKQPPKSLLKGFEQLIGDRAMPPGGPLNVLSDLVIHGQDIAVPLGRNWGMSRSALELITQHWDPSKPKLGERLVGVSKRVNGLSFQATDMQFAFGDGPRVIGAAQDIIMAVSGRVVSVSNLSGPGAMQLLKRLSV